MPAISEYVRDGRIIKLCDMLDFDVMLQKSDLTSAEKTSYANKMKTLIELVDQERMEQKRKVYRHLLLSSTDEAIYDDIASNSSMMFTIFQSVKDRINKIIDDIIENISPFLDELRPYFKDCASDLELYRLAKNTNQSTVQAIVENIDILIEMAREDLSLCTKNLISKNHSINQPFSILYYLEKVENNKGNPVLLPMALISVATLTKEGAFSVSNQFRQLLSQRYSQDRKIKKNLPCPLYVSGRETLIFYTRIGEVIIIIDIVEATKENYKRVIDLVRNREFANLLESIKNKEVKNDLVHTDMIFERLDNILEKKRFIY